jgi:hypothetical protein
MNIKTLDINAREWFDKVNGNSYFAGEIVINYGMADEARRIMPFQYGYGDKYMQEAGYILHKNNIFTLPDNMSLSRYCRDNNIILRNQKIKNCKKKDLTIIEN